MPWDTPNRSLRRVLTLAVLALGVAASDAGAQDSKASSFTVRGRIYDFQYNHPDFGIVSGDGLMQTAGMVEMDLDSTGVPTLSNAGQILYQNAYDKNGNPIALHLARPIDEFLGYGMVLSSNPVYRNNPTVDSYNPDLGPYGGANVFPPPAPSYTTSIPQITFPLMSSKSPDVLYEKSKTFVLDHDLWTDNLTIGRDAGLTIKGDVTIVVENVLRVMNTSFIELDGDATLKIYVKGLVDITNTININTIGKDFKDVTIYYSGTSQINLGNAITFYGSVYAPNAMLYLNNGVQYYGAMAVKDFENKNDMGLHLVGPGGIIEDPCYWAADREGLTNGPSDGGIKSASSFATWFQDVPGMNAGKFYRYGFVQQSDGSYVMEAPAFDPINDELYGNEGMANNGNFTSVIDAQFYYAACANRYVEVETDCECWAYVNGELVLDISGNAAGNDQRIDFDRLELEDGKMYDMKFFIASRTGKAPYLKIRTNDIMFSTYDVATPLTYLGD